MKTFRKFLLLAIVGVAGTVASCTDYQDEIDALDYRVTELEKLVKRINSDIESLQIIADALENADYITNVTQNSEGYIITFKKAGAVIIHDGKDGKDGLDGQDAQAPDISMKQGPDGYFYWTIDGEFVVTPDGTLVRASGKDGSNGKDGKDGIDGKDGKDGIDGKDGVAVAPQIRINPSTYYWEVSYDGGGTWIGTNYYSKGKDGADGKDAEAPEITAKQGTDGNYYWAINGTFIVTPDGKMVRANGQDGKDGKDGVNGKNGQDGRAVSPQLRINPSNYIWEISYDGGNTWISTNQTAKGNDGANGQNGRNGIDGRNGADGDVVIKSVQFITIDKTDVARFYLATGYFDVPIMSN